MKDKFRRRLGLKKKPDPANRDRAPVAQEPTLPEHTFARRYPKHRDPLKGQVYGGECNTTACLNRRAINWNIWTHGLYCRSCAEGQNYRETICIMVKRKPTLEEQEKLEGWREGDMTRATYLSLQE